MSYLIQKFRLSKRQLHLLILAIAVVVVGWPLVQLSPRAEAANPIISSAIELDYDGLDLNEGNGTGSLVVNDDVSTVTLNPSYTGGTGGTGTWEYSTDGGVTFTTLTLTGGSFDLPFPIGSSTSAIVLRYTEGLNCWEMNLQLFRPTAAPTTDESGVLSDGVASPESSGCCTNGQTSGCKGCEDPSKKSATRSPEGNTDGGSSIAVPQSLSMEVPLAAFPNEPDMNEGRLLLYLAQAGTNAGAVSHLKYGGVPTMEILQQTTNPSTGISYQCVIQQASGFAIQFEVPTGQSVGRPSGHFIYSGARIELLDGTTPTTNPASATRIRQYRQAGGTVLYDKSTGAILEFKTRTGRTTTFPDSRFEIVYSDAPTNSKIRQVRSEGGLLDVVETNSREYTIRVYQPGSYTTSAPGAVSTINAGANPRRSVTVSSPSGTPNKINITHTNGARSILNEWEYSTAANNHTWTVTRKNGGSEYLKVSRTVSRNAGVYTVTKKWEDLTTAGGATTIYDGSISKPFQAWGGRSASSSGEKETSTATTDIARSRVYYTNATNAGSYGKLSSHTLSDGTTWAYEYDANGRMTKRTSAWLDDADGKTEVFGYTPHTTGETVALDDYRPRTTTVSLGGNEVSKTFFSAYFNGSNEYVEIREKASSPTASFGAATNLRTATTYWATSASAERRGRIKSVVRHDGTGADYDYSSGAGSDEKLIVTTRQLLDSSLTLVDGFLPGR